MRHARALRRDGVALGGGPPPAHADSVRCEMSVPPERSSEVERVSRPDLDEVLADEKTKELIEEFEQEARTRTLTGAWAGIVNGIAVAVSLFALNYAIAGAHIPLPGIVVPSFRVFDQTITTPQIYVMIFLTGTLILTFLLYPAIPRFRGRITLLDLVPAAGAPWSHAATS